MATFGWKTEGEEVLRRFGRVRAILEPEGVDSAELEELYNWTPI